MKIAALIKLQISAQEKRLGTLQNNLSAYRGSLAEIEAAKAELEQIRKQYDLEFKVASFYPNRILVMDSLGLVGFENIQSALTTAYSGTREKTLIDNIANTLTALKNKIRSEKNKITTCKQSISTTKDTIASLYSELADAL